MLREVKIAARVLGRTPMLTAVTILTLALGIGANTAIFSVVNGALLRPLPYPDADRIVQVSREFPDESWPTVSIPKFVYWRDHNTVFDHLAAVENFPSGYNVTGASLPERIPGLRVTADFFSVFGVAPARGRDFLEAEDAPGGPKVVALSDGLWRRRFGGDPSITDRFGAPATGPSPDFALTNDEVRSFHEHGFLSGVRLLSHAQVELLRGELSGFLRPDHEGHELWHEYHSNESTDPDTVLFHALGAWRIAAGFHDLLWNPRFTVAARQLLGGRCGSGMISCSASQPTRGASSPGIRTTRTGPGPDRWRI